MITIKCCICGKEKRVKPIHARRGAKFCSVACYRINQKLNPNSGCFYKGQLPVGTPFKKGHLPHNTGRTHLAREKNPNWKGGRLFDGEYICILQPSHPFANKKGYICEHRLVVEKHLGRYLTKKEVVHHINQITHDNRLSNLYLFQSTGEHLRYHLSKNRKLITESNLGIITRNKNLCTV